MLVTFKTGRSVDYYQSIKYRFEGNGLISLLDNKGGLIALLQVNEISTIERGKPMGCGKGKKKKR